MMRKITKFLILTVIIAAVSLFAVNEAGAYSQPDFTCDGTEPAGECDTVYDDLGREWVVEIIPDELGNFPAVGPYASAIGISPPVCADKRGNPIECVGFAYYITAPPGGTLSQFNILVPGEIFCNIEVVAGDRGVKRRTEEPTTGFGAGDSVDAITWDSAKQDPENHSLVSVKTTIATSALSRFEVKTDAGNPRGDILTPACCADTNVDTLNLYTIRGVEECEEDTPILPIEVSVGYDRCSGVPEAPTINSNPNNVASDPVQVVTALCEGDAGGPDLKTCRTIQLSGNRSWGSYNACVDGLAYNFFVWGEFTYRIATTNPCYLSCDGYPETLFGVGVPTNSGLCLTVKEFNNGQYSFEFDADCNISQICVEDDCGLETLLNKPLWVCSNSDLNAGKGNHWGPSDCEVAARIDYFDTQFGGVLHTPGCGGWAWYRCR
jgi:hypothetical protein